jgi:hypothetical protein
MTITTQAQLDAALKFDVTIIKNPLSQNGAFEGRAITFHTAGNPVAGSQAGSSPAAGVIETDATTGCPTIPSFGGLDGHIVGVTYAVSATNRSGWLYDRLWRAGTYAFNANQAVTASALSRVPGGDFKGLELWIEVTTDMVGTATVTILYEDENSAPRTSTTTLPAALANGRCYRANLAGAGISKVTNVQLTGATGGAINVAIMRRLVSCLKMYDQATSTGTSIPSYGFNDLQTGFVRVYEDSALVLVCDNATSARNGFISIRIAVG